MIGFIINDEFVITKFAKRNYDLIEVYDGKRMMNDEDITVRV